MVCEALKHFLRTIVIAYDLNLVFFIAGTKLQVACESNRCEITDRHYLFLPAVSNSKGYKTSKLTALLSKMIYHTNILVQCGEQYCVRLQVIAKNAMQVPGTAF